MEKRRKEYFNDKKCSFPGCEETKDLEIDHINPREKKTHRVWSMTKARRDEELKKCQVLCHKHHWEKTKRDMGWELKHGTENGYNRYHCRCKECVSAAAASRKERRTRLKK